MPDSKLTGLTEITVPQKGDEIYIAEASSGESRSIKYENLLPLMGVGIGILQMFPALTGLWASSFARTVNLVADISGNGLHLGGTGSTFHGVSDTIWPLITYHSFNGSSNELFRNDSIEFDITGTEANVQPARRGLTIGSWTRFTNVTPGAAEYINAKYNASGNQRSWRLYRNTDGTVHFEISSTGASMDGASGGSAAIGSAVWTFLVGRFIPAVAVQILVNGVVVSEQTTSVPTSIFQGTAPFSIASDRALAGNFLAGQVSMPFVCAANVPDEMLLAYYNATSPLFE